MSEKITCPRRMNEFGPWEHTEGLDQFISGHGLVGQDLGCSFCGSMDPETVLTWMANGANISPTDKNYKLYIGKEEKSEGKFYFQHFNEEQKDKFIELYNTKPRTFTINYPGYFYVMPYFCKRGPVEE